MTRFTIKRPPHRRRSKKSGNDSASLLGRDRKARIEHLERRELLDSTGFLQGTSFIDTGNHTLGPPSTYLPGATVLLYSQYNLNTPLATTTTNQYGQYYFGNLQPGQYHIVEIPPAGYANSATQAESQVNPVIATTNSSIDVKLLDPSTLTATINTNNIASLPQDSFTYRLFGKTQDSQGNTLSTLAFQAPVSIDGGPVQSMMSVDLVDFLTNAGNNTFSVLPGSTTPPFGPGSGVIPPGKKPVEQNAGRIDYLMNHYGTQALDQTDAVGLQMAIWKLVVDTNDNMTGGNFQILNVQPNTQLGAEVARAKQFIDESAGKNEVGEFLDATNGGTISTYTNGAGLQSLVATGSLNFGNTANPGAGDVDPMVKADKPNVNAGGTVGFTITLNAQAASTGVSLTDVLPAGAGNDIVWSKDSDPSSAFTLSGNPGSQVLMLNASTLTKGTMLTVHVTGTTSAADVGSLTNIVTVSPNPNGDGGYSATVKIQAAKAQAVDAVMDDIARDDDERRGPDGVPPPGGPSGVAAGQLPGSGPNDDDDLN